MNNLNLPAPNRVSNTLHLIFALPPYLIVSPSILVLPESDTGQGLSAAQKLSVIRKTQVFQPEILR